MLQCWEFEADTRPTFSAIVETLSQFLEAMVEYMDIGAFATGEMAPEIASTELNKSEEEEMTVFKNDTFIELETIVED